MTPPAPLLRTVSTTASAAVLALAIGFFPTGPALAATPEPSPTGTQATAECGLICVPILANNPDPAGRVNPRSLPSRPPSRRPRRSRPPSRSSPSRRRELRRRRQTPLTWPRHPRLLGKSRTGTPRKTPQPLPVTARPRAPPAVWTGTAPSPGLPGLPRWLRLLPPAPKAPTDQRSCPSPWGRCWWAFQPAPLPGGTATGTGSAHTEPFDRRARRLSEV